MLKDLMLPVDSSACATTMKTLGFERVNCKRDRTHYFWVSTVYSLFSPLPGKNSSFHVACRDDSKLSVLVYCSFEAKSSSVCCLPVLLLHCSPRMFFLMRCLSIGPGRISARYVELLTVLLFLGINRCVLLKSFSQILVILSYLISHLDWQTFFVVYAVEAWLFCQSMRVEQKPVYAGQKALLHDSGMLCMPLQAFFT